jgi:hypothetical protein
MLAILINLLLKYAQNLTYSKALLLSLCLPTSCCYYFWYSEICSLAVWALEEDCICWMEREEVGFEQDSSFRKKLDGDFLGVMNVNF